MPIRLSDYIVQTLAEYGIGHVFMVTGGAAMHLNDAFGKEGRIKKIYCHHEQSCAMAAESYFRVSNRMAAVNVTAGPGATNAITGVYGAHVDSMAMIVVSGIQQFSANRKLARLLDFKTQLIILKKQ